MIIREHSALIGGRTAYILAVVLTGGVRGSQPLEWIIRSAGFSDVDADALRDALRDLDEAGQAWLEAAKAPCPQPGHADVRGRAELLHSEPMDTSLASTILKVSPRQVRRLARAGLLRGVETRRGWRFDRADVDAYLADKEAI